MRTREAWTDDQVETLRINYPHWPTYLVAYVCGHSEASTYQKARQLGLAKSAEYLASPASGRLTGGDGRGAHNRFTKGHEPANKGLRRPGWAPGRMAQTQFRKGERHGVAVALYQPIGTERISKDGYLERKVNDDLPLQARWRGVHRIVWEAANGPVPPGHAVAFLPGRRTTDSAAITVDVLELVSRAELMRRNTRHRYPPELNQLLSLKAALTRKINRRTKGPEAA